MKQNIDKKEKISMLLNNQDSLPRSESAVEIQQTTRGRTQEIKVYRPDEYEALDVSNEIYEKLEEKYGNNQSINGDDTE